jgi:hypothetical protein
LSFVIALACGAVLCGCTSGSNDGKSATTTPKIIDGKATCRGSADVRHLLKGSDDPAAAMDDACGESFVGRFPADPTNGSISPSRVGACVKWSQYRFGPKHDSLPGCISQDWLGNLGKVVITGNKPAGYKAEASLAAGTVTHCYKRTPSRDFRQCRHAFGLYQKAFMKRGLELKSLTKDSFIIEAGDSSIWVQARGRSDGLEFICHSDSTDDKVKHCDKYE